MEPPTYVLALPLIGLFFLKIWQWSISKDGPQTRQTDTNVLQFQNGTGTIKQMMRAFRPSTHYGRGH